MFGHAEKVLKFGFGLTFGFGKAHALANEFFDTGFGDVGEHVDIDGLIISQVGKSLQGDLR